MRALGDGRGGDSGGVDEIARVAAGRVERATQAHQRVGVEIGGHGDDGVDALRDRKRAQVRRHFDRDAARGVLGPAELAPVVE